MYKTKVMCWILDSVPPPPFFFLGGGGVGVCTHHICHTVLCVIRNIHRQATDLWKTPYNVWASLMYYVGCVGDSFDWFDILGLDSA